MPYLLTGTALWLLFHFIALGQVPGFHYDEAWAATFAHRIATEPGFWPFHAMSPYTSAWSHYVSAAFEKIGGPSVTTFRTSGVFLCFLGVLGLSTALWKKGEKQAALLLPWVSAVLPVSVISHRFAIEIDTFLVFSVGLLAFAISLRGTRASRFSWPLIVFACFVGITSHILFLATVLAWGLSAWLPQGRLDSRDKLPLVVLGTFLTAFFIQVNSALPEHDRGAVLIALALGFLLWVTLLSRWTPGLHRALKITERVLWVASIPFVFYLIVFLDGSWSASVMMGGLASPLPSILFWCTLGLCVYWVWMAYESRKFKRLPDWAPSLGRAILFSAFITGVMLVKPVPRMFEAVFLLLGVGASLILVRLPPQKRLAILAMLTLTTALQLRLNLLSPGLSVGAQDRDVHFLFFKDSSTDFLDKQGAVFELASRGCSHDQVRAGDGNSRIQTALDYIALKNWHSDPTRRCPQTQITLTRAKLHADDIRCERWRAWSFCP